MFLEIVDILNEIKSEKEKVGKKKKKKKATEVRKPPFALTVHNGFAVMRRK